MTRLELDPSQVAAKLLMIRKHVAIVTGGPGTGKTTILREALADCEARGEHVGLCAPTGKAAKRMEEATGRPASTVHRLLGYRIVSAKQVQDAEDRGEDLLTEGIMWTHNRTNPVMHGAVFVDEASMLDVHLFSRLLDALAPGHTRLILIGDANQLPSVGPGSVFGDLVNLPSTVPCARLTQVHRSAAGSWVCVNAPKILAGEELPLEERGDFRFIEVEDAADIPDACAVVARELKNNSQILIPQRTGAAGTDIANEVMQQAINPPRPDELAWFEKTPNRQPLRPRDKVIHTKNNYTLGVFNGEVGIVEHVNEKILFVRYPDKKTPVEYAKADAFDLKLAYAMTVHKSQGSEWPWIVCVVHSTHSFMLTRRLIYTGITRGKAGVVIIGDRKGVARAVGNDKDTKRNTSLGQRLSALVDLA